MMTNIELTDEERQPCEVWKDIKGFNGLYSISNIGRIKRLEHKDSMGRLKQEKTLTVKKRWKRYINVELWKESKRYVYSLHRLVYETFIGNIHNDNFIHHKDGNKENNRVDNLEQLTVDQHNKHHFNGVTPWNKGLNPPKEIYKKMWETRRNNKKIKGINNVR